MTRNPTKRENEEHWDHLGARYAENWAGRAQQELSGKELAFVRRQVARASARTALDVGIGTGRVLGCLLESPAVDAVYGIDVAERMVEVCQARFGANPKVRALVRCDIARETPPVPRELGFISAVRVLKYDANWWEILEARLIPHLAPEGIIVFSMPNANSVKRIARAYPVDYFTTTGRELRDRLDGAGLEVLELTGFAKLPDPAYRLSRAAAPTRVLLATERALDRLVGPATFSRELFVAARRRD